MEHRQPRLNGDTRHRKRRLREKLAKLDTIRYAATIRAAAAEMKRRVTDRIEREIFLEEASCNCFSNVKRQEREL
jgi:hypothetical protein